MDISKYFTPDGDCPTLGDPYREGSETSRMIFDDNGNVNYSVYSDLRTFCQNNPVLPFSDAVKIIHAEEFASNTKGNYSAIYAWR